MPTIENIVREAHTEIEREWGDHVEPASTADLQEADAWIREHLGVPVPEELMEFWLLTDGFDGNGVALYGPDTTVETTELYIEDYPDHLMVGNYEDGPQFTWNRSNGLWETLEQTDFDDGPRMTRATFAEVAQHCLRLLRREDLEEAW